MLSIDAGRSTRDDRRHGTIDGVGGLSARAPGARGGMLQKGEDGEDEAGPAGPARSASPGVSLARSLSLLLSYQQTC